MQKKIERHINNAGCLILTVLLLCGCASGQELVITPAGSGEMQSQEAYDYDGTAVEQTDAETESQTSQPEPKLIYVQVSGAVYSPGVYALPEGARVFEAIEKAGGMTEDAVPESVNQASVVTDGSMVILYDKKQWGNRVQTQPEPATEAGDGRVNINTASEELLCTIPGIGQTRAQSIITYRENNGAFHSVEEIMKVSGIKDGLFQKIKDKIKV